ncbi:DUF4396 domain-containing protein [Nocardioides sp. J54]|uniref:DUF4396 domain-containing protein n=1 Tax=Nocardioides sp. J54 TaxID=935866 RepID=UPI001E33EF3B|nr:DUF4396 domain-containing protein [Nocardioides sp. J54]
MQEQPTHRADVPGDSEAHPGHGSHGSVGDGPDDHHGQHPEHDDRSEPGHSGGHGAHGGHPDSGSRAMAASATLHCLSGCAVGEISGLMIGTAIGLSTGWTIALAVGLAFFFGYLLSTLPLVKTGLGLGAALGVVFAADTLSIAVMEIVDNAVMALIPNAMDAGLVNWIFWVGMAIALTVAFFAAYPVNRYLLQRGKGHALTHQYHHGSSAAVTGVRRYIPTFPTSTLVAVIAAFMLGGLIVSIAAEGESGAVGEGHAAPRSDVLAPAKSGTS